MSIGIGIWMDHRVHRPALQECQQPVYDGEESVDTHGGVDGDLEAPLRRKAEIEQEERLLHSPMDEHVVNLFDEKPLEPR